MAVEDNPVDRLQCAIIFVEGNTSRQLIKQPSYKKWFFCMIIQSKHFVVDKSDQRPGGIVLF